MTTSPTATTYREDGGTPVPFGDALKVWAPLGYDRLLAVAEHYNGVITYKELAEHVQAASGIRTRTPAASLVTKLLELCAIQAAHQGEPPLTSLCLRQDGSIGESYWLTPLADDVPVPTITADSDVDMHAAEHRLLCYRRHATDLPEHGGVPSIPEKVELRRERTARKADRDRITARAEATRAVCPSCFTELPASGVCWQCD